MGKRWRTPFFSREVSFFFTPRTSQAVRKTFFPRAKWNFARGKKVFLTNCEVQGVKKYTPQGRKKTIPPERNEISQGRNCSVLYQMPIGKSYSYIFSICANNAKKSILEKYSLPLWKVFSTAVKSILYRCEKYFLPLWKVFSTSRTLQVENTFHSGREYFSSGKHKEFLTYTHNRKHIRI